MFPGAPGSLSAQESDPEPGGGLTSQTDLVCSDRTSRTNGRNVDIGLWGHGRFRSDDFPPHSLRRDPIQQCHEFSRLRSHGQYCTSVTAHLSSQGRNEVDGPLKKSMCKAEKNEILTF